MNLIKGSRPFIILILLGFLVLIFSIFDIMLGKGLIIIALIAYAVLIALTIIISILRSKRAEFITEGAVEEFEKTLKGGLYHFKCQTCSGIFAIKKSKSDNKKSVSMTCPDCGAIGVISPNPAQIEEEIPEKKSIKANFKCDSCGEGITVWAEGTELYKKMNVQTCPFCGEYETMARI